MPVVLKAVFSWVRRVQTYRRDSHPKLLQVAPHDGISCSTHLRASEILDLHNITTCKSMSLAPGPPKHPQNSAPNLKNPPTSPQHPGCCSPHLQKCGINPGSFAVQRPGSLTFRVWGVGSVHVHCLLLLSRNRPSLRRTALQQSRSGRWPASRICLSWQDTQTLHKSPLSHPEAVDLGI